MSAPYYYDEINTIAAAHSPSTVHCHNTELWRYYFRYLIQQAIAQFKWALPEGWDADYFLYTLYGRGYLAIFDAGPLFGVIPNQCTLRGLNVYYHPTHAMIANPLLPDIHDLQINRDCVVLKLQPNYSSICDKVSYYADMMALCDETATVNLFNSQLSYVLAAGNKTAAEALKKMFDQMHSGNPAVAVDKMLLGDDGKPTWLPFNQDVGTNFVVDRIQMAKENFKDQFLTDLGIPNANTHKRERLVVAEVKANQTETAIVPDMWIQHLQDECRRVKTMFGIDIGVEWRFDPAKGGVDNASDVINNWAV